MAEGLDDTEQDTFAAIGRALTEWESVEISLADLYSLFRNAPFAKQMVGEFGHRYGTTVRRLSGLDNAAAKYFVRRPGQEREGEFQRLRKAVEALSIDRHRIAHGLVDRVNWGNPDGTIETGFALVAPWYAERRLGMSQNDAWDSAAIYAVGKRFVAMSGEITEFSRAILADRA